MSSDDGGLNWGFSRQVAEDNFIFGPGKGVQKASEPHVGRLILPGYANGDAQIMFSDDTGVTWQRSAGLSGGDEADVAELADGSLYLTACHRARISRAPEPNTRQFSISSDISAQWPDAQVDARLSTPVCQATVLSTESGDLLFANPAHSHSRAHMTVRRSSDNGASWPSEVMVYPGPAGYSVLAQGSDGDIYLLYENGNMAYSERISVARIEPDSLLSIR